MGTMLFQEDIWVGHCSLVVLFWYVYAIANEHDHTIASIWDGQELKIVLGELLLLVI
jgi:hypothetical protein